MKSIRRYVKRPIPQVLREQLINTALVAHRYANTYEGARVEVEITLRNGRNPNGLTARANEDGAVTVERFINLGWAKRNGYK